MSALVGLGLPNLLQKYIQLMDSFVGLALGLVG